MRHQKNEEIADDTPQRLQKALAQVGVGSRREMEELIAAGRVRVNGVVATLGISVTPHDRIEIDRRRVHLKRVAAAPRIVIYHKPEGEIVSRDDPGHRPTVYSKLPPVRGARWIAVGRLDYNSSGLLIFTTDGALAHRLMHPSFEVEREYAVRVMGEVMQEKMDTLCRGVDLEDGPARLDMIRDEGGTGSNHWYRVILREGRNREVRRIFQAVGVMVSRLMRVRFGIINMPPRLKRGHTLELTPPQIAQIFAWAGLELTVQQQRGGRVPRRMRGQV